MNDDDLIYNLNQKIIEKQKRLFVNNLLFSDFFKINFNHNFKNHFLIFKILVLFKIILISFRLFFFSLFTFILHFKIIKYKKNTDNYDYIFLSHYTKKDNLNNDYIFGNIVNSLKIKYKVHRILINHQKFSQVNSSDTLIPKRLSFVEEIKLTYYQITNSFSYLNLMNKNNKPNINKYYSELSTSSLSNNSSANIRISLFVINFLQNNITKKFVTTYEGHPWEINIFKFLKSNSEIKSYGYIHSYIKSKEPPHFTILFPKFLLTVSDVMSNQLKINYKFTSKSIIPLGSPRFSNFHNFNFYLPSKSKNILLLPEGNFEEFEIFINFIKHLNNFSDYNFTIKLHPLFKIDTYDLPSNLKISYKSLDFELSRNNFLIYRGTTAVFRALNFNILPIYLNINFSFNKDPFYFDNKTLYCNFDDKSFFSLLNTLNSNVVDNYNLIGNKYINYYSKINLNKLIIS
tara:strand:+ start:453 stop:1829 length:1377 start_codon:yes stop_codon:yes gene_type:complete